MSRCVRILGALVATALLAGCSGWEGPGNWLDEEHLVGMRGSACAPADHNPDGSFPQSNQLDTGFAGWDSKVRAQALVCVVHTDPFNFSKAAWVNCSVQGPAVITHNPPLGGKEIFVAGPGPFELRMTKHALSCRPGSARQGD